MNVQQTNLIAAIVFVVLGLWGAYGASSPTAYIAPGIGVVLLILHPGFIKEGKVASHIIVILTGLLAGMLVVPLIRNLTADVVPMDKVVRIGIMFLVAAWACIKYIKYFRMQRALKD